MFLKFNVTLNIRYFDMYGTKNPYMYVCLSMSRILAKNIHVITKKLCKVVVFMSSEVFSIGRSS